MTTKYQNDTSDSTTTSSDVLPSSMGKHPDRTRHPGTTVEVKACIRRRPGLCDMKSPVHVNGRQGLGLVALQNERLPGTTALWLQFEVAVRLQSAVLVPGRAHQHRPVFECFL